MLLLVRGIARGREDEGEALLARAWFCLCFVAKEGI